MTARIIIKYNHLNRIAAKLPEAVSAIVRKAAFDVEADAKMSVPVDTGTLKNSIMTEFTTVGGAVAMSGSGLGQSADVTSAIVAPHTEYAAFVEFGTRRQRAKPYMRPAAEKVAPAFIEACRRLEERLK